MKIGVIVQARMSSERLPGKVLHVAGGKPLLQYLLERLERCTLIDAIIVATSTDDSDTPLEAFCNARGALCYRGPLQNVASRFIEVLDRYQFDAFVRVSGDSPLLDPKVIDKGVSLFRRGSFDLVTNVFPRSYPSGQSVEVIRSETFRRSLEQMRSDEEREHVTPFFYRHSEKFKICNFSADLDYTAIRLAVDSLHDLRQFEAILSAMDRPHWEYGLPEIIEICRSVVLGPQSLA